MKEVENNIHACAAFAPVLFGEENNLDEVKAMVQSCHLTAGQAFLLYSQLDSTEPREVIVALQSKLEKFESFEELFHVARLKSRLRKSRPQPKHRF